jgi:hypothetical protein
MSRSLARFAKRNLVGGILPSLPMGSFNHHESSPSRSDRFSECPLGEGPAAPPVGCIPINTGLQAGGSPGEMQASRFNGLASMSMSLRCQEQKAVETA